MYLRMCCACFAEQPEPYCSLYSRDRQRCVLWIFQYCTVHGRIVTSWSFCKRNFFCNFYRFIPFTLSILKLAHGHNYHRNPGLRIVMNNGAAQVVVSFPYPVLSIEKRSPCFNDACREAAACPRQMISRAWKSQLPAVGWKSDWLWNSTSSSLSVIAVCDWFNELFWWIANLLYHLWGMARLWPPVQKEK